MLSFRQTSREQSINNLVGEAKNTFGNGGHRLRSVLRCERDDILPDL